MKPVKPQRFYVTDWTLKDPACVARMERMMAGFGRPVSDVRVISEDDIEGLVREMSWVDLDIRQGRAPFGGDPDVVFNSFRWTTPEQSKEIIARHPVLQDTRGFYTNDFLKMLYGFGNFFHYEDGNAKRNRDVVCWSLYDLHSAYGCFHKCQYCRRGRVTNLMLDVEAFVAHVDDLMARNSWQTVFRYDVETDCLILEPEYGVCEALVDHFASLPDKYLILFSKSDNVDFLLDLDHRGHTIVMWTLSTPTVSRRIEIDTATTEERIEAARKCAEAGYGVRFKCKPIIPIANWRAEATQMLELLLATVRPENLSLDMLFFDTVSELKELFDMSLFDPALIERMEKYEADGLMTDHAHPFPFDLRAEIYEHYIREVQRLSPETPVSLCAETREMWELLGPLMGMDADHFVCNCGPICDPGVPADGIALSPDGKAVRA